jgi:hypothetical protein
VADRVLRHEVWGELVDDGGDHDVEVSDLVVQLEVAPGQRLERDPVGRGDVAVVGHVWPPGGKRPDEPHAGQLPQLVAEIIGGADDRVVDHLQRNVSGVARMVRVRTSYRSVSVVTSSAPLLAMANLRGRI